MAIIKHDKNYAPNGYMNGECPSCHEWEAPITIKELRAFKNRYVHVGSSEHVVDPHALYYRETWKEYFKCPKCATRFSVEYSNI